MIPEVLVNENLKTARRFARECAERVQHITGCHVVAVVAEMEGSRACTTMAVDPSLDDKPEEEVALMKCALARVLSLLVLHLGRAGALVATYEALQHGAELAEQVLQDADDSAR